MEGATNLRPSNTRIAVVTGGNKGIGLEVCRQLATGGGVTVLLTARDETRGEAAVEKLREAGLSGDVIFHQLEITDDPSIARLAEFLRARFGKLDILINNAAVGAGEYVQDPSDSSATEEKVRFTCIFGFSEIIDEKLVYSMLSACVQQLRGLDQRQRLEVMFSGVRETYDAAREGIKTNYYGTKNVIEALLPLLKASSDGRIVNVSSEFGLLRLINNEELKLELDDAEKLTEERLDELLAAYLRDFAAGEVEARGWPLYFSAYKVSKVMLNAYTRILARRHPELRINCAHPGYAHTDMTIQTGPLTPQEGASNLVKVALLPEGGPTGAYFAMGEEAPFV
ncbi:hypothetical protein U9M48_033277 [Paspalum notatum var. saurae]|uniref:Short-chain dehydrogenase/reductase n=1 Tax=Paspalum notatum var. saurae TaxID=547442 RepID=A0AAQ3U974_PASNO